jgi:hypothetical protein
MLARITGRNAGQLGNWKREMLSTGNAGQIYVNMR